MSARSAAHGPRSAALAAALILLAAQAHAQDRPNVVVVVADDLGLGDLGPYGQDRIETPALDALAAAGTTFERAYAAAPVCAPSRCAILTGLHAGHCSVRRNRQPNVGLGLSDPTIADTLHAAGYHTVLVGKWGLGGESSTGVAFAHWSAPGELGFRFTTAFLDDEAAVSPFPSGVWREGTFRPLSANGGGARGAWIDDITIDEALSAANEVGEPFLLVVASTLPHRELFAPDVAAYAGEDWPEIERTYAAMVSRLDADVGRVRSTLDALGIADRTIVVVTSDNGPNESDGHLVSFFDSTGGLRGHKRDLYEGGLRVPLLVAGPGIPGGTRVAHPVSLVDLFPTVAALADAPTPDGLDGTSLVPALAGETPAPRTFFFGAAEAAGGGEPPTRYALLDWPLVLVEREDGVTELYDLSADPGQRTDLAAARPADVERLRALRIAESTGSLVRSDPVLSIAGEELPEPALRDGVVVLDVEPGEGTRVASRIDRPALTGTRVGGTVSDGFVLDRARADHLAFASHPALSFGDESFGVEARVTLRTLAATTDRAERQWLAVVKPTGTEDGAIDWGVLVQAADAGASDGSQPGALALVFGRGRLREDDVWVVRSRLAITDRDTHDVVVRFDAAADRVAFELDGERDEIVLGEDLGHVRSDGPLVIGAHHAVSGAFDEALDGTIGAFRLLRGAGPASPEPPRTLDVEIGSLVLAGPPVVRTLHVVSTATAPSRAMSLTLGATGDDRIHGSIDRHTVLGSTDPGATLTLTVTPTSLGEIDATFTLEGTALRLEHPALGSPLRVHVRGRVGAPPEPAGGNVAGWLEGGFVVVVLLAIVWIARRRT